MMVKIILILAMLLLGWFAGAGYMRWSIAQMFAEGQGRVICEAVLAEGLR